VALQIRPDIEEERFAYFLTINGKEHGQHFEDWKREQMVF